MFSPEYSTATSFRVDKVAPGIQTVRVMPWKGVDADCVWIDPAFACVRDGLFPPGLDSIHPTGQQVVRRGPRRISGAEAPASGMTCVWGWAVVVSGFRGPHPGMTVWGGWLAEKSLAEAAER